MTRVGQMEGEGPEPDAAFDVTVKDRGTPLRDRTTHFEPSSSLDTITFARDAEGSIVTYDAKLTLNGPLALGNPILGLSFGRIGDRARAGLIRVLDGERLPDPSN